MATPNNIGIKKAATMTDAARFSERDSGAYGCMNAMLTAMPRRRLTVSAAEATAIPIRNAMCLTTARAAFAMVFIFLENVKVMATPLAGASVERGIEVELR